MARRRRRNDSYRSNESHERVLSNNATAIAAVLGADEYVQAPSPVTLSQFEDLRTFHPEGALRAPLTVFGNPATWSVSGGPSKSNSVVHPSWGGLGRSREFFAPGRVVMCVRRKQRREVLFAFRRTGRGSHAPKSRTWRSGFSCK